MANTILTASIVGKEALNILTDNLIFISKVNRTWEGEFEKNVNGYKIGTSVNIRRPARYTSVTGAALSTQDLTEVSTSLTINTQRHVDVTFTSQELTLNISQFSDRVLKPAMVQLANDVDTDALQMYNQVHNLVGTPGTTPNSFLSVGNALRRLNEEAAPTDDLTCLLDPAAGITMADALKGTFYNPTVSDALGKGFLTKLANSGLYMSQGLRLHTVGGLGGTPLVNGASQTGSSLVTDGWTAAAANRLKKGDVFTIAGVFAVNPLTRQSTGQLRNFLVTADGASDGSGNLTISIYPAITTSGALQTVTGSPADNAALTILTGSASTAYTQNLMFHQNAFAFASVPLAEVKGVHMYAQERFQGLNLRIVQQYTISNDSAPCRADILYGYNTVFPELAVRISG